jgi:undecaprenyl diphosphate synthase
MFKRIVYRLYERRLLAEVLQRPTPHHLGLIQYGHRRYARHAGLSNLEGYQRGATKTEDVLPSCAELKIPTVNYLRESFLRGATRDEILHGLSLDTLDSICTQATARIPI